MKRRSVGVEEVIEGEGSDGGDVESKGRRRGKRDEFVDVVLVKPCICIVFEPQVAEVELVRIP